MGCNSSTEAVQAGKGKVRAPEARSKPADEVAPGAWVPLPMAVEPVAMGMSHMNNTKTSQYSIRRDRTSVNATITTMVQARRLDLWSNDSDLASRDGRGLTFAAHGDGPSPLFSGFDPLKPLPDVSGEELLQFAHADTSSEKNGAECGDLCATMLGATMAELATDLGAAEARESQVNLNLPPAMCLTMYTLAAHDLRGATTPLPSSSGSIKLWRTDVACSGNPVAIPEQSPPGP